MRIIVTCPKCGHKWQVEREKLISGEWIKCPQCEGDEKGG